MLLSFVLLDCSVRVAAVLAADFGSQCQPLVMLRAVGSILSLGIFVLLVLRAGENHAERQIMLEFSVSTTQLTCEINKGHTVIFIHCLR